MSAIAGTRTEASPSPFFSPAPPRSLNQRLINAIIFAGTAHVESLVELRADINCVPSGSSVHRRASFLWKRSPPLLVAVIFEREDVVRSLIKARANLDATRPDGSTAIHLAAQTQNIEIVKLLVEARASVTRTSNFGITPLMEAVQSNAVPLVKYLIDAKSDINQRNELGETACLLAIKFDANENMKMLLEAKADVTVASKEGDTPLHFAAMDNVEMTKMIIEANANVNVQNRAGETPLHFASRIRTLPEVSCFDVLEIINLLIEFKANVCEVDNDGDTPLMEAADAGEIEIIKCLVEASAVVTQTNSQGWTALHCAARSGHADIVAFLLERGADVFAEDSKGATAADHALDDDLVGTYRKEEVLEELVKAHTRGVVELLTKRDLPHTLWMLVQEIKRAVGSRGLGLGIRFKNEAGIEYLLNYSNEAKPPRKNITNNRDLREGRYAQRVTSTQCFELRIERKWNDLDTIRELTTETNENKCCNLM